MKTAELVQERLRGFTGHANLYRLDPPHEGHKFVVVSAVFAMFSGNETYIFPADAGGVVTSWIELEGSFRGGLDHAEALRRAGYEVAEVIDLEAVTDPVILCE